MEEPFKNKICLHFANSQLEGAYIEHKEKFEPTAIVLASFPILVICIASSIFVIAKNNLSPIWYVPQICIFILTISILCYFCTNKKHSKIIIFIISELLVLLFIFLVYWIVKEKNSVVAYSPYLCFLGILFEKITNALLWDYSNWMLGLSFQILN